MCRTLCIIPAETWSYGVGPISVKYMPGADAKLSENSKPRTEETKFSTLKTTWGRTVAHIISAIMLIINRI